MEELKNIYFRELEIENIPTYTMDYLMNCCQRQNVICGTVICYEKGTGVHVDLGVCVGLIPEDQWEYDPNGRPTKIASYVSKIGQNVVFTVSEVTVTEYGGKVLLSRKNAQKMAWDNYISRLEPGEVIPACVTHLDEFGAFCDIGYGIKALLPIHMVCVGRIANTSQVFDLGQKIYVCVKSIVNNVVTITHKELLGTWEENIAGFEVNTVVEGVVSSIEKYGIFVALAPNLCGLADIPNRADLSNLQAGDRVKVFIRGILPGKMKVKLVIIERLPDKNEVKHFDYKITSGKLSKWVYTAEDCEKLEETVFEQTAC